MSVVIGWLDNGTVTGDFADSVSKLAAYEATRGRLRGVMRLRHGPQMPEGRNLLVEQFLETDADYLMQIDTDMVFNHRSIENLLDAKALVASGLCFGINQQFGQFPTVYQNTLGFPAVMFDYPDEPFTVAAVGGAFVLTHREAFIEYERASVHRWYHRREIASTDDHQGGILGEDLSWSWHLTQDCAVEIVVDPRVEAGHIKPSTVTSMTYIKPMVSV